jgi:hypothetical protein
MKNALRTHVAAALLLLPMSAVLVAAPAAAQQRAVVAQQGVRGMSLNSNAGLQPGATLLLQVSATPGARNASVTLGDSDIRVPLREQGAGNYTGAYTIRRSDRIDPLDLLTVRVNWGDQAVAQRFYYPPAFQALARTAPAAVGRPVAPPPVAVAPAAIDRFTMNPARRIVPGGVLKFRLAGAPRADVSLEIPGVVTGVEMRETRPGVYDAEYTVRRADRPEAFDHAVASLRKGNERTTARLEIRVDEERAGRPGRDSEPRPGHDNRPPQITQVTPANGELVAERQRTRIFARLSDEGSGIDPASVRLIVDGLDVTPNSRITEDEVRYREELGRGRHKADLLVRDRAGNVTRTAWSFEVQ